MEQPPPPQPQPAPMAMTPRPPEGPPPPQSSGGAGQRVIGAPPRWLAESPVSAPAATKSAPAVGYARGITGLELPAQRPVAQPPPPPPMQPPSRQDEWVPPATKAPPLVPPATAQAPPPRAQRAIQPATPPEQPAAYGDRSVKKEEEPPEPRTRASMGSPSLDARLAALMDTSSPPRSDETPTRRESRIRAAENLKLKWAVDELRRQKQQRGEGEFWNAVHELRRERAHIKKELDGMESSPASSETVADLERLTD